MNTRKKLNDNTGSWQREAIPYLIGPDCVKRSAFHLPENIIHRWVTNEPLHNRYRSLSQIVVDPEGLMIKGSDKEIGLTPGGLAFAKNNF